MQTQDNGRTAQQKLIQAIKFQQEQELPAIRGYIDRPLEVIVDATIRAPWLRSAIDEAWRELRQDRFNLEWNSRGSIDPQKLRELSGIMEGGVLSEAYPASFLMAMLGQEFHEGEPKNPWLVITQGRIMQGGTYLRGGALPEAALAILSLDQINDIARNSNAHRDAIAIIHNHHPYIDPSGSYELIEDAQKLELEIAKRVLRHEFGHLHGLPIITDRNMTNLNGYHCGDNELCMMRAAQDDQQWILQFHQELLLTETPHLCAHCEESFAELQSSPESTF